MASRKTTGKKPDAPNAQGTLSLNNKQKQILNNIIGYFGTKKDGNFPDVTEMLDRINAKEYRLFRTKLKSARDYENFLRDKIKYHLKYMQDHQFMNPIIRSSFNKEDQNILLEAERAINTANNSFRTAHETFSEKEKEKLQSKLQSKKKVKDTLKHYAIKSEKKPEILAVKNVNLANIKSQVPENFQSKKNLLAGVVQEGGAAKSQLDNEIKKYVAQYSDVARLYRDIRKSHGGWKQWAPERGSRKDQIKKIEAKFTALKKEPSIENLKSLNKVARDLGHTIEAEFSSYKTGDASGKASSALLDLCRKIESETNHMLKDSKITRSRPKSS